MTNFLILRFYHWDQWEVYANTLENVKSEKKYSALTELTKVNQPIVVLIPGQYVAIHKIVAPKLSKRKLEKTLPFLLEEELLTDTDNTHFVLGEIEDGFRTVAVIDKTILLHLEQILKNAQLTVKAILPDFLAIPQTPGEWSIRVEKENTLIRTGFQTGFSLGTSVLASMLPLALETAKTKPKQLNIYITLPFEFMELEPQWKELCVVRHINEQEGFFVENIPFDLRVTQFIPTRPPKVYPYRFIVTVSILIAGVIFIVSNLIQWMILHRTEKKLNAQITSLYYQIFKTKSSTNNPRLMVQHRLKQLQSLKKSDRFLQLIGTLANTLRTFPSLKLDFLSYQNDACSLRLQGSQWREVETFLKALTEQGLTVKENHIIDEHNVLSVEVEIK